MYTWICLYAWVCVHMYVCPCVCVDVSMHDCICSHVYAHAYPCACKGMSVCIVCVYMNMHGCVCVCPHVCAHCPCYCSFLEPSGAEYPDPNIPARFPGDRDTLLTSMSLPRLGKELCHRWSIHISPGIPTTSFPCGPGSRPGAHSIFNCQVSSHSMTQNDFSIFLSAASLRVKAFRIDCGEAASRVASLLVPGVQTQLSILEDGLMHRLCHRVERKMSTGHRSA